jgi:hypothetical protein
MMSVFQKTAAGAEEVKRRSDRIDQRTRTLLLLVDGKSTGQALIDRLTGIGVNRDHFQKLLDIGLIERIGPAVEAEVQSAPPATERRVPASPAPEAALELTDADRYVEGGKFLNQAASDLMGFLAAASFQQKVARAGNLAELRALKPLLLEAITKKKGDHIAHAMSTEFERIVGS